MLLLAFAHFDTLGNIAVSRRPPTPLALHSTVLLVLVFIENVCMSRLIELCHFRFAPRPHVPSVGQLEGNCWPIGVTRVLHSEYWHSMSQARNRDVAGLLKSSPCELPCDACHQNSNPSTSTKILGQPQTYRQNGPNSSNTFARDQHHHGNAIAISGHSPVDPPAAQPLNCTGAPHMREEPAPTPESASVEKSGPAASGRPCNSVTSVQRQPSQQQRPQLQVVKAADNSGVKPPPPSQPSSQNLTPVAVVKAGPLHHVHSEVAQSLHQDGFTPAAVPSTVSDRRAMGSGPAGQRSMAEPASSSSSSSVRAKISYPFDAVAASTATRPRGPAAKTSFLGKIIRKSMESVGSIFQGPPTVRGCVGSIFRGPPTVREVWGESSRGHQR